MCPEPRDPAFPYGSQANAVPKDGPAKVDQQEVLITTNTGVEVTEANARKSGSCLPVGPGETPALLSEEQRIPKYNMQLCEVMATHVLSEETRSKDALISTFSSNLAGPAGF